MTRLDLNAVMDGIAARLRTGGFVPKVYEWPSESPTPPCAIVGYPETIEWDFTFADASDRASFPVWLVVGRVSDRTARDRISDLISGVNSIKALLDGNLGGVVQTCRVEDCSVENVSINAVDYLAAKFTLDVIT